MTQGFKVKYSNGVISTNKKDGQFLLFGRKEFLEWLHDQVVKREIRLIQNHHTWKPDYSHFDGENHFDKLKGMKKSHLKRGFSDIAQNITTFPDGTIAVCRPIDTSPAGIKGANKYGICIEHLGDFDQGGDEITDQHKKTIVFINAALCLKLGLEPDSNTVVYHHWWTASGKRTNGVKAAKSCPGTNFFGGNKVEDAEKNFIPLISDKLEILKTI